MDRHPGKGGKIQMEYDMSALFKQGKMTSPCLHCAKRNLGCHSKCEMYGAYKRDRQEVLKRSKLEWKRGEK